MRRAGHVWESSVGASVSQMLHWGPMLGRGRCSSALERREIRFGEGRVVGEGPSEGHASATHTVGLYSGGPFIKLPVAGRD